jgi:hypothetical protein
VQWLNATAPSGEYLDVLSGEAWRWLRDPVREALHGAAPQAGPIADIGAGSGLVACQPTAVGLPDPDRLTRAAGGGDQYRPMPAERVALRY